MARALEEYEGKLADTVERFSASSSMQTDAALQTVNNNSMATGKLTAVVERIEGTMQRLVPRFLASTRVNSGLKLAPCRSLMALWHLNSGWEIVPCS